MKPDISQPGEHVLSSPDLTQMLCNIAEPPEDRLTHIVSVVCHGHREAEAFGTAAEQAGRALAHTVPWVVMPDGGIGPVSPLHHGEVLMIMASYRRACAVALNLISDKQLADVLAELRDAFPNINTDRERLAEVIALGLIREQEPNQEMWTKLAVLCMVRALLSDRCQRSFITKMSKLGVTPGIVMLAVEGATQLVTLPIARCADIYRPAEGNA